MTTTTIAKNIPLPRKRVQGLTVTLRAVVNSATPLGLACFYGLMIVLLLAPLYPAMSQANFEAILSSNILTGILGGHITHFSGFTAFLGVEVYSAFYGLLFGGFAAWIGGAAIPITIEDGTLDLVLARPISRTRYYLENWLAALVSVAIIGLVITFGVWLDTFIVNNANIDWQWLWITQLVQWGFMFFAAGLGMLFGSFLNASRAAGGTAVGIIMLAYLINTFGGLTNQFNWLLNISPFHYAPTIDPLVFHQLTWWHPVLLALIGLACGLVGLFIFNKRDLPTT